MNNHVSLAHASFDLPTLTQVVSDVTRFPVELLQPDVDFEDELGIDSLKQAEIAAVLADRLGVPRQQLGIINDAATIRDLLTKLNALSLNTANGSSPSAPAATEAPAPPAAEVSVPSAAPTHTAPTRTAVN